MSLILPTNARGPILELTLPESEQAIDIVLRNKTTEKTLRLKLPAGWDGDDLSLNFFRRTITDQTGADRSALLDPDDNELWSSNPLISGANDIEIEAVGGALVAKDDFKQSAGNLTGKALEVGGVWEAGGDVDDATVNTTADTAKRTAEADAFGEELGDRGRVFGASGATLTNTRVRIDAKASTIADGQLRLGAVARYQDAKNWAAALIGSFFENPQIAIIKAVGGAVLQNIEFTGGAGLWTPGAFYTIQFDVTPDGDYRMWYGPKDELPTQPAFEGNDADFNSEGPLAEGKPGFYDELDTFIACTREYDHFRAYDPDANGAYAATATLRWEKGYY